MVLVNSPVNETTIMWISIVIMLIVILLTVLIALLAKKPAMRKTEDYVDKVARRKEIDKQIKALAAIAITTKDTLDKLRDEQDELDEWLEAYKVIHKE